MSDDEADPELLALLAQSLGIGPKPEAAPTTGVLKSVEYVYDNAIDVAIVTHGTKQAAVLLYEQLQKRQYSTYDWAKHELHPKPNHGEATVNFIFTMSLLNFSFWSELPEDERFAVDYMGRKWTGYWSLVAALQRGLEEGYPITTPTSWSNLTNDDYNHIFRSATSEQMPLLEERLHLLRKASHMDPIALVDQAKCSAARLVNLLTSQFPNHFFDTDNFGNRTIYLHKRAQILVADLWACFRGKSFGEFSDIDTALTMFADYRVPQMLQRLGVLRYSPRLESKIRRKEVFESGEDLEVEIRGCSVWAVELLRREIVRLGGERWEAEVEDDEEQEEVTPAQPTQADSGAQRDEEIPASVLPESNDIVTPGTSLELSDSTRSDTTHETTTEANPSESHKNAPSADQAILEPPILSAAPAESPQTTNPAAEPSTHPPEIAPPALQSQPASVPVPTITELNPTSDIKKKKTIKVTLNAILLDYLLYDTAKELEAQELAEAQALQQEAAAAAAEQQSKGSILSRARGGAGQGGGASSHFNPDGPKTLPHHRCRSIWY